MLVLLTTLARRTRGTSHLRAALCAVALALATTPAAAHGFLPTFVDLQRDGDRLILDVRANLEALVAGIDLGRHADSEEVPDSRYDRLRTLPPEDLAARFREVWRSIAADVSLRADGLSLAPRLTGVTVPPAGDPATPRDSRIRLEADLPPGAAYVEIGWDARHGAIALRQTGVPEPYRGHLAPGETSPAIRLAGGGARGTLQTFADYVPVGFVHIVPRGLDHILFVLGLYFLAARLGPLLWQISAFTLAHTLTLAAASLGHVSASPALVEPLIAASIVFVAVENLRSEDMSRWRLPVVFAFGLLHGLGFAAVLGDYGLPRDGFLAALLGFNVGVELGQLTVVAAAFVLVGFGLRARPWYRSAIALPASLAIACVGSAWFVERVWGYAGL